MTEKQRLTFLQDCLRNSEDADIKAELRFHYELELGHSGRSVDGLIERLEKILNRAHDQKLRDQHTRTLQQQMTPKGPKAERANVQKQGKEAQDGDSVDPQLAALKEQMSHKDRQISGLVSQLKNGGVQPEFAKKPGAKGDGKRSKSSGGKGGQGKDGKRSSSDGRSGGKGNESGYFTYGDPDH